MFEAYENGRDQSIERILDNASRLISTIKPQTTVAPMNEHNGFIAPNQAVLTVLEAGFRARVMAFGSAYDLGARCGYSAAQMRERAEICASLITAGLSCAVDERLFAALVYHFPDHAKKLAHHRKR